MKDVIFNAEETNTVFLHYFFIRRTAEGGKNIERIQLSDAGTAPRD